MHTNINIHINTPNTHTTHTYIQHNDTYIHTVDHKHTHMIVHTYTYSHTHTYIHTHTRTCMYQHTPCITNLLNTHI